MSVRDHSSMISATHRRINRALTSLAEYVGLEASQPMLRCYAGLVNLWCNQALNDVQAPQDAAFKIASSLTDPVLSAALKWIVALARADSLCKIAAITQQTSYAQNPAQGAAEAQNDMIASALNSACQYAEDAKYEGGYLAGARAAGRAIDTAKLEAGTEAISQAVAKAHSDKGRKGIKAKLANDQKQLAKAEVKVIFLAWQNGTTGVRFKNYADFGRKMVERFPKLTDQRTPAEWCTAWQKELKNNP